MHQPLPYGYFGPTDLSAEDAAFTETLMRRVTNIRQAGALESLRITRALPGGGSATVLDMCGIRKVFVTRATSEPYQSEAESEDMAAFVPMLFSGRVHDGLVKRGQKVEVELTRQTQSRLNYYGRVKPKDKERNNTARRQKLERFVVPLDPLFGELMPKDPGQFIVTQYDQLRPSWYSGAMAEVVQIIGGYGKSEFDSPPKDPTETARLLLPAKVVAKIAHELNSKPKTWYTGIPPKTGQVKYDYKFSNTHGVVIGSDKTSWLVRISSAGVYAMPLPLVPATTTLAFKAYMEEVGDDEMLWAINRYGGLPSGEAMPESTKALKAWERAGVCMRIGDAGNFYKHAAYSPCCGWSFNTRGDAAVNTCWDWSESTGVKEGMMFSASFSMGAPRKPEKRTPKELEDISRVLSQYGTQLAKISSKIKKRAKEDIHEGAAVLYKLKVISPVELAQFAATENADAAYDFVNNKKLTPIATHSCSIAETARGSLHYNGLRRTHPKIFFPDPIERDCAQFDFRPLPHGVGEDPKCDTIMYAYYQGDSIKVVKFFKDPMSVETKGEDNFTDCMIVGSWERTVHHTNSYLWGNFYSSDFDDRKAMPTKSSTTTVSGSDMGYGEPYFAFDALYQKGGTLTRAKFFTTNVNSTTTEGKLFWNGVCIPYFCRTAYLYASKDVTGNSLFNKSSSLHAIGDPTSYRFWTYHKYYHWTGGVFDKGGKPKMDARPFPKDANPVWVELENYSPGGCSDFADNGPWIPNLPADYTWLIHPKSDEFLMSGGGKGPSFSPSSSSGQTPGKDDRETKVCMTDEPMTIRKDAVDGYFPSHDFGMRVDAVKLHAGTSKYASTSESGDIFGGKRFYQGYTSLADHGGSHHFIGVINE